VRGERGKEGNGKANSDLKKTEKKGRGERERWAPERKGSSHTVFHFRERTGKTFIFEAAEGAGILFEKKNFGEGGGGDRNRVSILSKRGYE